MVTALALLAQRCYMERDCGPSGVMTTRRHYQRSLMAWESGPELGPAGSSGILASADYAFAKSRAREQAE